MKSKITVMDSFNSDELGFVVTGEVSSGSVKVGDVLCSPCSTPQLTSKGSRSLHRCP